MRIRMINVLAPTVFVEGLSQEDEAFYSCFLCHSFSLTNPGSTEPGTGQDFSIGLIREDYSNTIKVWTLVLLRFSPKAPRPQKDARWCYHQKLDLNLRLTRRSVTSCLPFELFGYLRLPKPEGGRNNLVMNWSLFLGHALAYIKLDLGEFKLI